LIQNYWYIYNISGKSQLCHDRRALSSHYIPIFRVRADDTVVVAIDDVAQREREREREREGGGPSQLSLVLFVNWKIPFQYFTAYVLSLLAGRASLIRNILASKGASRRVAMPCRRRRRRLWARPDQACGMTYRLLFLSCLRRELLRKLREDRTSASFDLETHSELHGGAMPHCMPKVRVRGISSGTNYLRRSIMEQLWSRRVIHRHVRLELLTVSSRPVCV